MTRVKRFFIMWPELWGLPLVLIKFFVWSFILRWLDPTAATFDVGILHKPSVVMFNAACYNALAWIVIRLNFPPLFKVYKEILLPNHSYTVIDWNNRKYTMLGVIYLGLFFCFSLMGAA